MASIAAEDPVANADNLALVSVPHTSKPISRLTTVFSQGTNLMLGGIALQVGMYTLALVRLLGGSSVLNLQRSSFSLGSSPLSLSTDTTPISL